jgi:hypothetical protein
MTDQDAENTQAKKSGSAAQRPHVNDTPRADSHETEAGQEATRGIPPGSHDDEHQSNYGGGGENGGSGQ